jgi:hypothetical protein
VPGWFVWLLSLIFPKNNGLWFAIVVDAVFCKYHRKNTAHGQHNMVPVR